jgi:hypothetical protein
MFVAMTTIRPSIHVADPGRASEREKPMRCWVTGNDGDAIEPSEVLHPEGHKDQRDGTETGDEAGHDARYRVRHGPSLCP